LLKWGFEITHMHTTRIIISGLALALASVATASSRAPLSIAPQMPTQVERFGGLPLQVHPVLAGGEDVVLRQVPLDALRRVDLELQRLDVLAPDAVFHAASIDADGHIRTEVLPTPRVDCFHGQVAGEPESHVYLAIGSTGANGWIERDGELHVITTHPIEGWTAIYDLKTIDPADMNWTDFHCATEAAMPDHDQAKASTRSRGDIGCLSMLMAIETDWEFAGLFGGDLVATAEYIQTLIGAVSSIYDRDIGIKITVSYSRLWSDSDDPWTGSDSGNQLGQFQGHWETHMDHISRQMAHFLSGRNLGGGVAYLGTLCTSLAYAVSGNLGGSFPVPLEDNNGGNWDPMVVAHETGHTCGSGHTHDSYSPPIDGCGNGDCTDANLGTVMSYCHLCSGGLSNMVMAFHPRVQEVIIAFLESDLGCEFGGDGSAPVAASDLVETMGNGPVDIPVLINDYTNDCTAPIVDTWDALSLDGGTIELLDNDPAQGLLRYTPPAGGMTDGGDFFRYDILDGSNQPASAAVLVLEVPARAPDTPAATEPGPTAAYYELDNPQVLPDFSTLEPYLVEVVSDVNYPSTNGNFAGSGLSNDFGVVFSGFIEVPVDDWYTLYTDSDDGSTLYIGEELVVSNDGLHGMRERSGMLALQAGRHAVRVEFFERGGGAGCIVSIEGGGMDKQPVADSMWSHEVEVVGDVNGDGIVDVLDLLQIILEWGPCPPVDCSSDADGNGVVDIEDLLVVLSAWG